MACHFSPDVVRMLARGTLGAIVDHIGMKDELRDAVYAAVGGGHDTDPRDFAAIEDGDFDSLLAELKVGGAPSTLIQRGSVNRLREATKVIARTPQVDPAASGVETQGIELGLFSPGPSSAASDTGTANGNEAVAPLHRPVSPASSEVSWDTEYVSRLRTASQAGWTEQKLADWAPTWNDRISNKMHGDISPGQDTWEWMAIQLALAIEKLNRPRIWTFGDDRFVKKAVGFCDGNSQQSQSTGYVQDDKKIGEWWPMLIDDTTVNPKSHLYGSDVVISYFPKLAVGPGRPWTIHISRVCTLEDSAISIPMWRTAGPGSPPLGVEPPPRPVEEPPPAPPPPPGPPPPPVWHGRY